MLTQRSSFIDEVTQNEKAAERVDNIIFADIDRTLYWTLDNDDNHYKRFFFHAITPENQERLICSLDNIKTHPHIIEMQLDSELLKSLSVNAVSGAMGFDKDAIENLCILCKKYKGKIVLTSNWRRDINVQQAQALFKIAGLVEYESIIGFTPILTPQQSMYGSSTPTLVQRGNEIEAWLMENWSKVKSFVILDDEEFNIPLFFKGRFVRCEKRLFSDKALLHKADEILSTPVDDNNCAIKLHWNALKNNSASIQEAGLDLEKMTTLKLCYGYTNKVFLEKLFSMLEGNTNVTGLLLESLVKFSQEDQDMFMEKLTNLLSKREMKLDCLNITDNGIKNIDTLLSVIDGEKVHVNRIVLNKNCIENQEKLSSWLRNYPKPVMLWLYLSNKLSKNLINAAIENENVSIFTDEKLLPEDDWQIKQRLFSKDRHYVHRIEKHENVGCRQQ